MNKLYFLLVLLFLPVFNVNADALDRLGTELFLEGMGEIGVSRSDIRDIETIANIVAGRSGNGVFGGDSNGFSNSRNAFGSSSNAFSRDRSFNQRSNHRNGFGQSHGFGRFGNGSESWGRSGRRNDNAQRNISNSGWGL